MYCVKYIIKVGLLLFLLIPQSLIAQQAKFDSLIIEADSFFQTKEYEKSAIVLDQAFLLNYSSDGLVYYFAARVYSISNRIDKSIDYFEKSFAEKGTFEDPWKYFIYDKYLDNIRDNPRYALLESKFKNGRIDFFDIINDLQSSKLEPTFDGDSIEWVSYGSEVIYLEVGYFMIFNSFFNLKIERLSSYSYEELLKRSGRNDFNFEKKQLSITDSELGQARIPYLKLRELSISNCKARWVRLEHCDIEKVRYGSWNSKDSIETFVVENSKLDSIIVTSKNIEDLRIDSVEANYLNFQIGQNISTLENLTITNSHIGSEQKTSIVDVYTENFVFENNTVDGNASFTTSEFSKRVDVYNNTFNGALDISNSVFPEFNTYLPYRQLKKGLYIHNEDTSKNYFAKEVQLGDVRSFEKLLNSYQYLYNNHRQRGEIESANIAYVALKDLILTRQKYLYDSEGGFRNLFRFRLAQIMKFYTNHGTDPSLAMLISFYIILVFSFFYFFFPSEWDTTSKSKLVSNFKDFIQKNDKGYFKPFFVLVGGFTISLINAITLSVNSFVTLGFGTIPTTGLARYVCILQGFIGWFLLSIFTVALINQVLF